MKRTPLRKQSQKQKAREAQRKQVIEELFSEGINYCEVCKGHDPGWIPLAGHEIIFRSKGVKSCKMTRDNIIILDGRHHAEAQLHKISVEVLQEIVRKRNAKNN